MLMSDTNDDLPKLPGYVSIKEAARILGLGERTVYRYVEEKRLRGMRAANAIMIPLEDLQHVKRGVIGRERKVTPLWRAVSEGNSRFVTLIYIQMYQGKRQALVERLEEIRKSKKHLFPGTVARYIIDDQTHPGQVILFLIWRGSIMPEEAEREQALEAFRQELADVLDWGTAQYNHGTAFMHT